MGRRTLEERNVRSLTRNSGGRSYVITIPINIVRQWDWRHRQKLELSFDHKKKQITVKDWSKKSRRK